MSGVEVFNGIGVAFSSNPAGNEQGVGRVLVLLSLAIQICVIASFVVITGIFWRRCAKAGIHNQAVPKLLLVLYLSMAFIFIRCIYRLVEHVGNTAIDLSDPQELATLSPLERYEWFFYVFEGATMLANSLLWNVFNPGRFLPRTINTWIGEDGTEVGGPEPVRGAGEQSSLARAARTLMNLLTLGVWGHIFPLTLREDPPFEELSEYSLPNQKGHS